MRKKEVGLVILYSLMLTGAFLASITTGHCETFIVSPKISLWNHQPVQVTVDIVTDELYDGVIWYWGDGSVSTEQGMEDTSWNKTHWYKYPDEFTLVVGLYQKAEPKKVFKALIIVR